MGRRGPALDAVAIEEADKLRDLLRQARDVKGITNADIAETLGRDVRYVTNLLTVGRPMRAGAGHALVMAVMKTWPLGLSRAERFERDQRATPLAVQALHASLAVLSYGQPKFVPAALIPTWSVEEIADYLAGEIAMRAGVGDKRRRELAASLRRVLDRSSLEMAQSWWQLCVARVRREEIARLSDSDSVARVVMRAFGYNFRPAAPARKNPSKKGAHR